MNKLLLTISSISISTHLLGATPTTPPVRHVFDPEAIRESDRVWIELEGLYWQASEGGMGFATTSDSTTALQNGRSYSPSFNWDGGVRAGIGYKVPHDRWDIFLQYTYVQGSAGRHLSTTAGGIFPSWQAGIVSGGTYVTDAHAHWNGTVQMGDLELGRDCFVSSWLSIRPFVGVRGGVIDQSLHIFYSGGNAVPTGDTYRNQIKNDFWGVGARMGADSLWGLGAGFGIYANGAFSFLSGNFDVHQFEQLQKAKTVYLNLNNQPTTLILTAETALGIQWDYLFSHDRYHIGLNLGWEFNIFFNQNQMSRFVSSSSVRGFTQNDQDLSFQGATLGIRFDF